MRLPDACQIDEVQPEKVAKAISSMVSDRMAAGLAETFKVLGDATRVKIISILLEDELCVCEISSAIGLSQSAISHQLSALRKERIVRRRREGQKIYYALDDEHIAHLLSEGLDHISEIL